MRAVHDPVAEPLEPSRVAEVEQLDVGALRVSHGSCNRSSRTCRASRFARTAGPTSRARERRSAGGGSASRAGPATADHVGVALGPRTSRPDRDPAGRTRRGRARRAGIPARIGRRSAVVGDLEHERGADRRSGGTPSPPSDRRPRGRRVEVPGRRHAGAHATEERRIAGGAGQRRAAPPPSSPRPRAPGTASQAAGSSARSTTSESRPEFTLQSARPARQPWRSDSLIPAPFGSFLGRSVPGRPRPVQVDDRMDPARRRRWPSRALPTGPSGGEHRQQEGRRTVLVADECRAARRPHAARRRDRRAVCCRRNTDRPGPRGAATGRSGSPGPPGSADRPASAHRRARRAGRSRRPAPPRSRAGTRDDRTGWARRPGRRGARQADRSGQSPHASRITALPASNGEVHAMRGARVPSASYVDDGPGRGQAALEPLDLYAGLRGGRRDCRQYG